jgi:hypothetical protein
MSMTIWRFKMRRSISNIASAIGFIAFMVFFLLLVALTSPPQYRLNNTLGLAIFLIPITIVFLALGHVFSRPFEVVFTEDGLVVRGRRGFTVPKDAVVSGGVVCIRRSPVRLELRVTHGLNNYLIPLSPRAMKNKAITAPTHPMRYRIPYLPTLHLQSTPSPTLGVASGATGLILGHSGGSQPQ